MRVRPDSEVHVRLGKTSFLEEPVAHRHIIVLAGVQQDLLEASPPVSCLEDRSHFHEIWACPDHVEQFGHQVPR